VIEERLIGLIATLTVLAVSLGPILYVSWKQDRRR